MEDIKLFGDEKIPVDPSNIKVLILDEDYNIRYWVDYDDPLGCYGCGYSFYEGGSLVEHLSTNNHYCTVGCMVNSVQRRNNNG